MLVRTLVDDDSRGDADRGQKQDQTNDRPTFIGARWYVSRHMFGDVSHGENIDASAAGGNQRAALMSAPMVPNQASATGCQTQVGNRLMFVPVKYIPRAVAQ